MNRNFDSDGPDDVDVDATFAAIVADLRAEGVGNLVSDVEDSEDSTATKPEKPKPPDPEPPAATATGWRTGGTDWDATLLGKEPTSGADEEEHYVPPEPPPLPKPRKGAFIVLLFFVVGLLLLIAPGVVGIGETLAVPLGILSLAIGLALLLLRVKQGPPDGADPSTGAQV
ncbi:hypothetical protein [Amycolatopsis nigrescens]|uniref:hypothetical protein n=1 Tax=Amycolatopsis nigrescens TaxID=381445 RepID=UPI00037E1A63|nr:hypothetical protein [Amycolatopsis nigrescens]